MINLKSVLRHSLYTTLGVGVILSLNLGCSKKNKNQIPLESIVDYKEHGYEIDLPFIEPSNKEEEYVFKNNDIIKYMNWMRGKDNVGLVNIFSKFIEDSNHQNFITFRNFVGSTFSLQEYFPKDKIMEYNDRRYEATKFHGKSAPSAHFYQLDSKGSTPLHWACYLALLFSNLNYLQQHQNL